MRISNHPLLGGDVRPALGAIAVGPTIVQVVVVVVADPSPAPWPWPYPYPYPYPYP